MKDWKEIEKMSPEQLEQWAADVEVPGDLERRVGETLEVAVTTVLQTSADRLIFTRVKGAEQKAM